MKILPTLASLSMLASFTATQALAWGERGHDGVTRVAARIVAGDKDPDTAKFGAFLQRKENMLGHLSNVPDIVWRSLSPEIDRTSSPSHFIDFEYILGPGPLPAADKLPASVDGFVKALDKNCAKKSKDYACDFGKTAEERLQKSGHAPFRVQTLSQDLLSAFKELKALETGKDAKDVDKRNAAADRAILLLGLLSHFVGDLANPQHTAKDYDGWEADQGGLHSYFESEIVDSLGLDLEATVLDEAERHTPMAAAFAKHPHNYLEQAWELALDSHEQLPLLLSIDKKNAVIEKSFEKPAAKEGDRKEREKAKRKDVKETREAFRNLVILRLAAGADALSRIWIDTWREAGKPDLNFYRSYHYDVKPDFVPMRYLPSAGNH